MPPGRLSRGGQLQMLRATGQPDLRSGLAIGQTWPVTWVDIADPVQGHTPGTRDGLGVLSQGRAGGGSVFTRLEGCIAGADTVWFTSTNGGDAGHGPERGRRSGRHRLADRAPGLGQLQPGHHGDR